MRRLHVLVGCALLAAVSLAAPRRAKAEDDTPHLWQPEQAVAFLLGGPRPARAGEEDGGRAA